MSRAGKAGEISVAHSVSCGLQVRRGIELAERAAYPWRRGLDQKDLCRPSGAGSFFFAFHPQLALWAIEISPAARAGRLFLSWFARLARQDAHPNRRQIRTIRPRWLAGDRVRSFLSARSERRCPGRSYCHETT